MTLPAQLPSARRSSGGRLETSLLASSGDEQASAVVVRRLVLRRYSTQHDRPWCAAVRYHLELRTGVACSVGVATMRRDKQPRAFAPALPDGAVLFMGGAGEQEREAARRCYGRLVVQWTERGEQAWTRHHSRMIRRAGVPL